MLTYRKKSFCKALSMLMVTVMLLVTQIGTSQVYGLEEEQPAVEDIQEEFPLDTSLGMQSSEVLDSGTTLTTSSAPAFAEDYPKLGMTQPEGSKKIEILVKAILPEGETSMGLGYVLLAHNDSPPTAEQIKSASGKIPGVTVITWAQQILGDTETTIMLTGAQDDTDYDLYVVCWQADILSEVKHLDVKTPAKGSSDPGTPELSTPTGLQWNTMDIITAKWDPVANATAYDVTLWKEGHSSMLVQYTGFKGTELDVQANIGDSTGNYYFTVQAKAEGYTSSLQPASPIYCHIAPLYGNVTISNMSPKIGDTLTGSLVYGNNTGTLHYIWKADGFQVGADSVSYTVTVDDLGKTITLEITSDVETGARISNATAEVSAVSTVLEVTTPEELEAALGSVSEGGTIALSNSIDYDKGIVINEKSFCLDLGSNTLNVVNSTGIGIDIKNAILTVLGDGKLNATGTKGVQAQNSKISVHSATGTAGAGVEAFCGIDKSCEVTVITFAQGTIAGAYAMNDNCKIIAASAKATGEASKVSRAVFTEVGGMVEIYGNVDAPNGYGVYCVNSSAMIGGYVTSKNTAVSLYEKGSIVINGNVNADNGNGTAVEISGNGTPSNGTVTIGGAVLASEASYVRFVNGVRTKNEGVPDGAYLKYMDSIDGEKAGIIRVKKVPTVCKIDSTEFTSLSEAIDVAPEGKTTTITLLQSITHTKHIRVEKKTINLELGNYNLLLDTSADDSPSPAVMVIDGGKINLVGTGTGQFNVKGRNTAVSAVGVNTEATIHNVASVDDNGVNMVGTGDYLDSNSTVTVLGSITVGNGNGVTVNAKNGKVVVHGNIVAGRIGVKVDANPGTQVTVNGDITVIADTPENLYNLVGIRAYGQTTVTVAGNVRVQGTNCLGIHASGSTIKVGGNVASSGMGVQSDTNGKVDIAGSLSAGLPFITVGTTEKTAEQGIESGGGLLYTDGANTVYIGSVVVPTPIYTITVQNDGNGIGSASPSSAALGSEITLTVSPNDGYVFKEWQIVSGGVTITGNKFTMPANNVTVKAIFEETSVQTYTVIVNGSHASTTGAGNYTKDTTVNIDAGNLSNYTFTGWTSSDVTISGTSNKNASFVMPEKDVTVTANWNYNGGGEGGSSSEYTSAPIIPIVTDKQPDMPTIVKTNVFGTVKDGTLSATITEQMVKDAIKTAQDASKKSSKELDGIALNFNFTSSDNYTNLNVTIDADAIDRMKEAGLKFITIGSSVLDITLDIGAILEIDKRSTGTVTVSAKKITKLSSAAKKLIGNRPVFDITVSYLKNGKTEYINNFGKGTVTLGIAYKATDKENKGNLFGVYVHKNGKPKLLTNSSYNNTGKLIFSRNSLSIYGVGYKVPASVFTDTAKHWAKENIDFVASRDLISGTSATIFDPNTNITRADFLMALCRLSGADVSGYKVSRFSDVKVTDTAMPHIEWAVKNKIASGYGDGKFGPNDSITREQMAVMMINYAQTTGYKLPVSIVAVSFTDNAKISVYAKDAVKAIQQTGVINGKDNNCFDPQGNVTRAEASTILRRFVELVIDEGTARGWVQNDAGQWQWIGENGKPVIGWFSAENGKSHYYFTADGVMVSGKWLQIDGKWYYFNADGSLAKSTKVDGYEIDENGVKKNN